MKRRLSSEGSAKRKKSDDGAGGGGAGGAVKDDHDRTAARLAVLKAAFLTVFSEEISSVYDLVTELCPSDPLGAFEAPLGLRLTGPFDLLHGAKVAAGDEDGWLVHMRYFYDPPEVQTVCVFPKSTCKHWAYFRDDPSTPPLFVVESDGEEGRTFHCVGDTLLSALYRSATGVLADKLQECAIAIGVDVKVHTSWKQRQKRTLGNTISKLGIVVPYDREKDVGYRDLGMTMRELKDLFDGAISERKAGMSGPRSKQIAELRVYTDLANDEGDTGMSLEFGLDVFSHDAMFGKLAGRTLDVSYMLLNRQSFRRIAKAHLKNRVSPSGVAGGLASLSKAVAS